MGNVQRTARYSVRPISDSQCMLIETRKDESTRSFLATLLEDGRMHITFPQNEELNWHLEVLKPSMRRKALDKVFKSTRSFSYIDSTPSLPAWVSRRAYEITSSKPFE